MSQKNNDSSRLFDAGCLVELLIVFVIIGGIYWGFTQRNNWKIPQFLLKNPVTSSGEENFQILPIPSTNIGSQSINQEGVSTSNKVDQMQQDVPQNISPKPRTSSFPHDRKRNTETPQTFPPKATTTQPQTEPLTPWEKKEIRGIYMSRYQVTNNASEKTIRERVRYYKNQGFNTIIHGVWGNGCTMYKSLVMQQFLGYDSCPNEFQDQWLVWLIDEAHQQGMEVHAYFEKGIKIDKNSPIFNLATQKKWLVPGVDKTYRGINHYVLDVDVPEVANFFTKIVVEFVKKYPKIDAVQWDDYLGYHADLPGKVDRTKKLTKFIQQMINKTKQANPLVSFDISHHNPYWSKKYFAADWKNWEVDRVFIQAYNEKNFNEELNYAIEYDGIAITDQQLHRLKALAKNPKINSVLVFPLSGKPEETASLVKSNLSK